MSSAGDNHGSDPSVAAFRARLRALSACLAVPALWWAVFVVSCRIMAASAGTYPQAQGDSVAAAILGQSRLGMARHAYDMADLYFHRGVHHKHDLAFENNFFQRLRREVAPELHVHVHGAAVTEIMPWLWLTIRMDPHHAEPYLVAAFWLIKEGRRPDLALEVLQEAQCAIPFNYEIQLAKGRIYLKQGDLARAKEALDAGLAFWPSGKSPVSEDARGDRAALLLYRALLHETDGETEEAIAEMEEILRMFPKRTALRDRIEAYRRGGEPSLLANRVWTGMLREHDAQQAACHREDHAHSQEPGHKP